MTKPPPILTIHVRYYNQAYIATSPGRKERASCAAGPEAAAEVLARKIYGRRKRKIAEQHLDGITGRIEFTAELLTNPYRLEFP